MAGQRGVTVYIGVNSRHTAPGTPPESRVCGDKALALGQKNVANKEGYCRSNTLEKEKLINFPPLTRFPACSGPSEYPFSSLCQVYTHVETVR